MSDELKRFYRELWAWIQGGCPGHKVFSKRSSICLNLERWAGNRVLLRASLASENGALLLDAVGDRWLPFNSAGDPKYEHEVRYGSFYQNPKRLAFIEEHAK